LFVWSSATNADCRQSGPTVGDRIALHLAVWTQELSAAIAIACNALSKR